jgi:hypothetical protein
MNRTIAASVLALILGACGSEPSVSDPYADLAEGSLLVRFEDNPDVPDGQCNPNVHYALRTTEAVHLINANFEVVDQNLNGSGFGIMDQDGSGVASNTVEFNMFDPYPVACADLNIRTQDLTCRLESEEDSQPCPNPVFEGTEMFASFTGPRTD